MKATASVGAIGSAAGERPEFNACLEQQPSVTGEVA